MKDSRMRPFEHRPEALDAIGMRFPSHILTNRVLNRLMIWQGMVGQSVIGVDFGSQLDVLHNEAAHGLRHGIADNLGGDLIRGSIFDPRYSHFASRSTTTQLSSLGLAHVPAFSSHVGLVDFDRAGEGRSTVFSSGPGFSDSVEHEPCSGLTDPNVTRQFGGGDALQTGQFQINGHSPFVEREVCFGNGRPGADREIPLAISAPIRHGLSVGHVVGSGGPAMSTTPFLWPQGLFKPLLSCLFVGEHLHQLNDVEFPALLFSCLFYHRSIIDHGKADVK